MESPKIMGLKGIHDLMLFGALHAVLTVPGVARRGKMREPWSTI